MGLGWGGNLHFIVDVASIKFFWTELLFWALGHFIIYFFKVLFASISPTKRTIFADMKLISIVLLYQSVLEYLLNLWDELLVLLWLHRPSKDSIFHTSNLLFFLFLHWLLWSENVSKLVIQVSALIIFKAHGHWNLHVQYLVIFIFWIDS